MSDIVDRLQQIAEASKYRDGGYIPLGLELVAAIDEILRLRSENARIRNEAMEEAAKVAERCGRPVGGGDGGTYIPGTSSDAARAIRALSQANTEGRGEE